MTETFKFPKDPYEKNGANPDKKVDADLQKSGNMGSGWITKVYKARIGAIDYKARLEYIGPYIVSLFLEVLSNAVRSALLTGGRRDVILRRHFDEVWQKKLGGERVQLNDLEILKRNKLEGERNDSSMWLQVTDLNGKPLYKVEAHYSSSSLEVTGWQMSSL